MRVIRNIKHIQKTTLALRQQGRSIGLVPTMGALHGGHLSLIEQARKENDFVVVSIFVNPAQFDQDRDLRRYPRTLEADKRLCKKKGVDFVLYPDAGRIYVKGHKTWVLVEQLSGVLCGKFRPGHFKGVATIVIKLFNIVNPDIAYFGQKDAQQAIIIQQMVKDLNIPVKIRVLPIVRESDGLALSSRNKYLTVKQRQDATVLFEALKKAQTIIAHGMISSAGLIRAMRGVIRKKKTARIQYIEVVDLNELRPVKLIRDKVMIVLSVLIGKTRLIDNIIAKPQSSE